jgi:RNA polymerase sigma factor for flagellar operon FliA
VSAPPDLPARRAHEHALVAAAQTGDRSALEALLAALSPALHATARQLGGIRGVVDSEDLVAVGRAEIALRLAGLDPVAHPNLGGYLLLRARGEMVDHLRRLDPRSRTTAAYARRLRDTQQQLEQRTGRAVSADTAAGWLGLTRDTARSASVSQVSLDVHGVDMADTSPDHAETHAEADQVAWLTARLRVALGRLPEREREIVTRTILQQHRADDVAIDLCISRSRVYELQAQALRRLGVML